MGTQLVFHSTAARRSSSLDGIHTSNTFFFLQELNKFFPLLVIKASDHTVKVDKKQGQTFRFKPLGKKPF